MRTAHRGITFVVFFFVLWNRCQVVKGDSYALKETSRFDIPQCSDSSGLLCSDDIGVSIFKSKDGLVVNHQRGFSFMDDSSFPLKLGQEYATFCSTLTPIGEDAQGNILFSHANTPDCTCVHQEGVPCIKQPLITEPSSISGYLTSEEGIGTRGLSTVEDFNATAVFVVDGNGTAEGCSPLQNSAQVNGSIALALRGGCAFTEIIENAQAAGAKAVLVVNVKGSDLISMQVRSDIPALIISYEDGMKINETIASGTQVTIQLGANTGNVSLPGSAAVGLLSFPSSVFTGQGTAPGTANTDIFEYVNGAVIDVLRSHLWISDPNTDSGLIQIFNITDLTNPVLLLNLTQDTFPSTQSLIDNALGNVVFTTVGSQRYYVQPINADAPEVIVLDVTDLNSISVVHSYDDVIPDLVRTISDGAPEIVLAGGGDLDIVDGVHVYNLSSPSNSSVFVTQAPSQVRSGTQVVDLSAVNSKMFLSYGTEGLFLYDITTPEAPQLLTHTETVAVPNATYSSGVLQLYGYSETSVLVLNLDPISQNYSLIMYGVIANSSGTSTTTTSSPTSGPTPAPTSPPSLTSSSPTSSPTSSSPTTSSPTSSAPATTSLASRTSPLLTLVASAFLFFVAL